MSFLEIDNASIGFGSVGSRTEVLHELNLKVEANEFIAIIGFSGSGKSTLMSLLAGLQMPDSGEIRMQGKRISRPGPELGIMFQNYSLLPWLTVFGNIELAVRRVFPDFTKMEAAEHVERYLKMVSLLPAKDKRPNELSGGMRQRLSLARTLSMQPEVLLLDEPLSALDALTRAKIQDEIIRIWEQDKRTVVMITNDVDEAVLMADRIIPLTKGPKATFGREFRVNLDRPRDRTTLNTDPAYRALKGEITHFLLEMNKQSHARQERKVLEMPDVQPVNFLTGDRFLRRSGDRHYVARIS